MREKDLYLPMYGSLYAVLQSTPIGEDHNRCNELFEVILSVAKLMCFNDMEGIDEKLREYYVSLYENHIDLSVEKLNLAIRSVSIMILNELMANNIVDYIHYVVDYSPSKLVLRAYRLETGLDVNKGVENVI